MGNLEVLEKIYSFFTKKEIDKEKYIIWLKYASKCHNSYERNTTPMELDAKKIIEYVKTDVTTSILEKNTLFNEIWAIIEK